MVSPELLVGAFSPTLKVLVGVANVLFKKNYVTVDQFDCAVMEIATNVKNELASVYSNIFDASINSSHQFFLEATRVSNIEFRKQLFVSGVTELIRAYHICEQQSDSEKKYLQLTNVAGSISFMFYAIDGTKHTPSSRDWLEKAAIHHIRYIDKHLQNYRDSLGDIDSLKRVNSSYVYENERATFHPHSNWAGGGGFFTYRTDEHISDSGRSYINRKVEERRRDLNICHDTLFR